MKKAKRDASGPSRAARIWDRIASGALIGAIRLVGLLPYRWRVPMGGWLLGAVIAPLIGYRRRIRKNLGLIFPDMSAAEKDRLARVVPRQIGRTVTELFSPEDLKRVAAEAPVRGEGYEPLMEATKAGRPVILVSGHMGNYDIVRSALMQRGLKIGGLYRKMNYDGFNDFYVSRITEIGEPLFLRGRRGLAEMVRFLREGNAVAMLIDQHMNSGAALTFFGRPARTALSAAEMALKYDALLVPCYGIRQPDGLSFEVLVKAPVPHTTPEEMTQALNDSLEEQVRAHMDQWLWVHRRWKNKRRGGAADEAAADGGPEPS